MWECCEHHLGYTNFPTLSILNLTNVYILYSSVNR